MSFSKDVVAYTMEKLGSLLKTKPVEEPLKHMRFPTVVRIPKKAIFIALKDRL